MLSNNTKVKFPHLAQNKLHITELTVFPQFTVVLMQRALWVARELQERKRF